MEYKGLEGWCWVIPIARKKGQKGDKVKDGRTERKNKP